MYNNPTYHFYFICISGYTDILGNELFAVLLNIFTYIELKKKSQLHWKNFQQMMKNKVQSFSYVYIYNCKQEKL